MREFDEIEDRIPADNDREWFGIVLGFPALVLAVVLVVLYVALH